MRYHDVKIALLGSGQEMGHENYRIYRCAGGHRSQVPGVGGQVAGIRDGRRKTGDRASHGPGTSHGRIGTHGVPLPVPIPVCTPPHSSINRLAWAKAILQSGRARFQGESGTADTNYFSLCTVRIFHM